MDDNFTPKNAGKFACDCGKIYRYRQGLSKHKKMCNCENKDDDNSSDFQMLSNLVIEVVKSNTELQKQNQDFQKQLLEFCKNNNSNNINNSMVNSNNKAFNLQFFLNETCKDAMNISEFVDSLTLQLSDLENVGKLGFVEGMSNIIIENMKLLDISKRPIHCMDTKREVMYLKDQNTWEKTSDDDNKKIRRAIKQIATKNVKNLRLFKEKHPDCINYNSKYSDQYLKLQTESCGGKHPDYENESKIIKRLAKVMAVDKSL
jgi:predicted nucleic acid-binding protein